MFVGQGERLGLIARAGGRPDLAVLGANVPDEHGVDVYRWRGDHYEATHHRTCARDATGPDGCPVLVAAIDLRRAAVRSHAAPPDAPPRRAGADLQLDWVFVRPSRGASSYRLSLFVRVRGNPPRRLDLGEVPEPLRSLCRRSYPELQRAGGVLERFVVERRGSTYTIRREERLGPEWSPWRGYDRAAVRAWQFEGPPRGAVVQAMHVDGDELPCGAGSL
ncbi:MAG: hypothetical protein R3B82_15755 [Sandaracinaceae bacterium]